MGFVQRGLVIVHCYVWMPGVIWILCISMPLQFLWELVYYSLIVLICFWCC
uniref:Uncharacterized protein n=1 Tax=Rhizophora mucronata TaxID=61149 RepID=A0A2P2NN15_RHIMU